MLLIGRVDIIMLGIYTLQYVRNNWPESTKNISKTVHVNDVVTDCSYALAECLVSTLFGAFPGQS